MHKNIVLVAETGSDVTAEMARKNDIYLVPMHVTMGDQTLDDGAFPPEDVCAYYDRTGVVPKTSGSSPEDFAKVFDEIHERWPRKKILHLAYSASTTCSYQSALIAAEGRDYVVSLDTKQVSVGQAAVVFQMQKVLDANPNMTIEEAVEVARVLSEQTHMCFIPNNLDYLRAGGRVSNAVALVGNILSLHPNVEIIDGRLLAQKKYRGKLEKIVPSLIREHAEKYRLKKDQLYLLWSPGFPKEVRKVAEAAAKEYGFKKITWLKTGCVITCHGGPSAFGVVGLSGSN